MLLSFYCEYDLALTYALRRTHLARQCAISALSLAFRLERQDLVNKASLLLLNLNALG